MIEQRVTLRYGAQQIPAIVQAVQGDTGRDVIFELADYEIPAGATANYYIDKPDGNAVYNSAEVISSTEIRAHLTEQALAVPGRNNGQVRILSDDEVITSFDFVLEVDAFRGILQLQSETEVNIFDQALQAAAEDAIEEIQAQTQVVTGMQNSIAPSYSNSQTYKVGDYVMYNAQLYKCKTEITTGEVWTAAHWSQVPLANDVSEINERIDYSDLSIVNAEKATSDTTYLIFKPGYYRLAGEGSTVTGEISEDSEFACAKFNCSGGDAITICGNGSSGLWALYAFINSSNVVLYKAGNNLTGERTVIAPANTAYILINVYANSPKIYAYHGTPIKTTISNLTSEVEEQRELLPTYKYTDFTQGALNAQGAEGNSRVYCRTGFIPIEKIAHLYKPVNMLCIVYRYSSEDETSFIDRDNTTMLASVEIDYSYEDLRTKYAGNGTKYLRFTVSRRVNGEEVNSTPQDILGTDYALSIYGVQTGQIETEDVLPSYYTSTGYLQERLNKITQIQNTISANNDAFWLMSDYHYRYNAGHSQDLLKYLSKQTGITRLYFAGDAGGSEGTSTEAYLEALQHSANVWSELSGCVPEMFGVLGNHEWISSYFGISAMLSAYLNRYKINVVMGKESGNYYIDNSANKIRYFFLQDNISAAPVSVEWFGEQLKSVPEDYSVSVLVHHGYIPSSYTEEEYGFPVEYNYGGIKGISKMLKAWRDHESTTVYDEIYDYSTGTVNRSVIAVLCAHMHHSTLYVGGTEPDVAGITVFRASEDALNENVIDINGHPWFWGYNESTGQYDIKTERTDGTIYEQCFYCIQIDLTNKHMYITAIGGDRDWNFLYES